LVKWQEMRNNLGQEETQLFTPVSAELTTDKIYSSVDISRYQVLKNRPTTIVSEIHSNLISNNAPPLYHIRCWTWEAPWINGNSSGQISREIQEIIRKWFESYLEMKFWTPLFPNSMLVNPKSRREWDGKERPSEYIHRFAWICTARHRKGEEISSVINPIKRMLFTYKNKDKKIRVRIKI
jgi:hypothetical protein